MSNLSNITVVLPSLDPDTKLLTVINGLLGYGFTDIILVNDGSKPENLHYFQQAALHPEVHLLHHETNLGKGAALKTAFRWFLDHRPHSAGIITVDGDNQHHPEDTKACALRMMETGKIVLGVRDFSQPDVPARSRSGNRITSSVFKLFVGMTLSDTQTGLRAIPRATLPLLCDVYGDRFEYETNMLLAMKSHRLEYEELPIRTVYIEENKSSHFRAVRDSWRIYKLIFGHFFRYALSAVVSFIVDEGLYILLTHLLNSVLSGFLLTAVPVAVARAVSSFINFLINQKLVFQAKGSTAKALLRYYLLAVPLAIAQLGLTYGAVTLLQISPDQTLLRGFTYAVVMGVLFIISYVIQQRWVFTDKRK